MLEWRYCSRRSKSLIQSDFSLPKSKGNADPEGFIRENLQLQDLHKLQESYREASRGLIGLQKTQDMLFKLIQLKYFQKKSNVELRRYLTALMLRPETIDRYFSALEEVEQGLLPDLIQERLKFERGEWRLPNGKKKKTPEIEAKQEGTTSGAC